MKFDIKNPNVGQKDRVARIIVGILLIIGTINGGHWIAALIGLGLIASAWFRFCPAYTLAGLNTAKDDAPAAK
jgi:hypothetical protein